MSLHLPLEVYFNLFRFAGFGKVSVLELILNFPVSDFIWNFFTSIAHLAAQLTPVSACYPELRDSWRVQDASGYVLTLSCPWLVSWCPCLIYTVAAWNAALCRRAPVPLSCIKYIKIIVETKFEGWHLLIYLLFMIMLRGRVEDRGSQTLNFGWPQMWTNPFSVPPKITAV